ncbi:MAG: hypothetical protein DMG22_12655 [Acidobacteria bacterium]|nr:MAG: hypothetical protein DMG22_12655 [Acidobacteriota bacterium]
MAKKRKSWPKQSSLLSLSDNRPGTLAFVAKALGDMKVNGVNFLTTTSGAEGSGQLLVDTANKAKQALEGPGLSYSEADVLRVAPRTPLHARS